VAGVVTVTGAFSNIGRAAALELHARGWTVRTLTNRAPDVGDGRFPATPLVFDEGHLRTALAGSDALVVTYWVRTPHHGATFDQGVANTCLLIDAALTAGVGRIVYLSVSNAAVDSPLGYYRGKALVEGHLIARAASWGIVRPTLVVGPRDVLTGNIAWFLRRFPAVIVPAGGTYPLQPAVMDDVARLVADQVAAPESGIVDAAGPERFGFREYVRLVAAAVGRPARLVAAPPRLMLAVLAAIGRVLGDVVLTPEELAGLRAGMLVSHEPPRCEGAVRGWLLAHGDGLGRRYTNDRVVRLAASRAATPR
jgi:NADH dehydrogenase